MKLSEILKDWPEKKQVEYTTTQRCNNFVTGEITYINKNTKYDNEAIAYNTALSSCDREIDREALVSCLNEINPSGQGIKGKSMNDYIADHIISTMPTWLRKVSEGV